MPAAIEFSGPPPRNLAEGIAQQRQRIEERRAGIEERQRQLQVLSADVRRVAGERDALEQQLLTAMETASGMEAEAGLDDRQAKRAQLQYWLDKRREASTGLGLLLANVAGLWARQMGIAAAIGRAYQAAGGVPPATDPLADSRVLARARRFVVASGLGALFLNGTVRQPKATRLYEEIEREAARPYEIETIPLH